MSIDYKSTIFLPKTGFPMRAGLPAREPEILEMWEKGNLYGRIRETSKGRDPFILHDGPPYANGNIHIGTALNKILKDTIVRAQQMMGKDANYVPGWDCHGLPIEWKIEEAYRKKGRDKDAVPVVEFRKECREFAEGWISVQRDEFKRLGAVGDWSAPYLTMSRHAEAVIARELGKFLMNGGLYRGARPVMWSPVEKTALAEAEIEYHDHTSTTIHVRFPVLEAPTPALAGASIVIWTTTPWTMPGNRAVAFNREIDYVLLQVNAVEEGAGAKVNEKLVFAEKRLEEACAAGGVTEYEVLGRFEGAAFENAVLAHPLRGRGYDFDVPALHADFATDEEGTGFVHIAPGHGADDWLLGREHGVETPQTVGEDGCYYAHMPLFAGKHVYKVNDEVADAIAEAGGLLAKGKLTHRYPHSWRSKKPLIFRNTAQWFISMEENGLRQKALAAIEETRFVPAAGQNRLRGMIQDRPDWCVSRQRAWGVPITVFVNKETGEPLRDQAVMDRIVAAFEEEGSDAWFASPAERFLGPDYDPDDFEQVWDILDVWFDSGCTHTFVLEDRDDLRWPASLYLEGSDQHRGWFHSSLLQACGTRGAAPYEAVLTHGFVMAADGQKMSKSLGNTVAPQDVIKEYGADILRLWVVGSDYSEDLRIGKGILKYHADIYRRIRNTLRFLLGGLTDFDETERLPHDEMPELERWTHHRLWRLDGMVRKACDDFTFHHVFTELHNFCTVDLSAFYLDIRKDALYCGPPADVKRRAVRTVLDELFNCLTAWFAPFLCFTAEEAWQTRHGNPGVENSVHLRAFPDIPESWRNDALAEKWVTVRRLRRAVTMAIEEKRAAKEIRASLEAAPVVYAGDAYHAAVEGLSLPELFITSAARLERGDAPAGAFQAPEIDDVKVVVGLATGKKCERCWQVLEDVGADAEHATICGRCAEAVKNPPRAAG